MKEEWKDVVGYEELFQVSSHGRFFSKRSGKILKLTPTGSGKKGYLAFSTKIGGRDGKSLLFKAHQEVAKAFLEEPSKGLTRWSKNTHYGTVLVNHIDGDKHNNNYKNLEWCDSKSNMEHFTNSLAGKESYLSRNRGSAKLDEEQVREIRMMISSGVSQRTLAKKYNVSRSSINNAVNGYKWVR